MRWTILWAILAICNGRIYADDLQNPSGLFALDAGFKLNGSLDRYRYLAFEFAQDAALWHLGFDNESNAFAVVGQFQEYRLYAHRYARYDFLPRVENLEWFLGASMAGSQFVATALSPDIGFRSAQPLQLWIFPISYAEDISLYSNAIQCKSDLRLASWGRPFGWPIAFTPRLTHLWMGPLAPNTSSALGMGFNVKVILE